jgi:dTDP-4-dehydrorhamnose reductase
MSRWLITGAAGMLGRELTDALLRQGEIVTGMSRADLDVTDEAAVSAAVTRSHPDVVVNCAGWTAVDAAETSEDAALAVNGRGPAHLAVACAATGARLVQLSTNYVFSGTVLTNTGLTNTGLTNTVLTNTGLASTGRQPYGEPDPPAPGTAYGRTKLAGERAALSLHPGGAYVVRTAWLYGAHGPNFVATMTRLAAQQPTVDVVDDQHGQPTWAADVARVIIALALSGADPGIYHATSAGQTTWYGLAREVFRLAGANPGRVRPVTSDSYRRPAPRPAWSVLSHGGLAAAGVTPIGDWRAALSRAWPTMTREPADLASPVV